MKQNKRISRVRAKIKAKRIQSCTYLEIKDYFSITGTGNIRILPHVTRNWTSMYLASADELKKTFYGLVNVDHPTDIITVNQHMGRGLRPHTITGEITTTN